MWAMHAFRQQKTKLGVFFGDTVLNVRLTLGASTTCTHTLVKYSMCLDFIPQPCPKHSCPVLYHSRPRVWALTACCAAVMCFFRHFLLPTVACSKACTCFLVLVKSPPTATRDLKTESNLIVTFTFLWLLPLFSHPSPSPPSRPLIVATLRRPFS